MQKAPDTELSKQRQSEKAYRLPKNTAAGAVMTMICKLGGNRNTMRLPDIKIDSS